MGNTPLRKIRSFDEAVAVLGGTSNAGRLLDRTPQQICQYRNRHGAFPASLFPKVWQLLANRGYAAPYRLFTFESANGRAKSA